MILTRELVFSRTFKTNNNKNITLINLVKQKKHYLLKPAKKTLLTSQNSSFKFLE